MKQNKSAQQENTRKIWPIRGGVHPRFHKECSTRTPINTPPVPATLVVPVVQHIGEMGHILVTENQRVKKGQPLTDLPEGLGAITHAPTSGIIRAIEERNVPHVSGLTAICVVIDSDGKEDWGTYLQPGYADFRRTDTMQLCERMRTSGLVGLGGAAFPSAAKLAASSRHGLETLIINGAECEPYITCDDMLMRSYADQIVEGIAILLHILKPKECLIGIEDNKPEAIAAMQAAVQKFAKQHAERRITIVSFPAIYPAGDEKQLIRILTGKQLSKQTLPFDHGILVHNVATVYSIYLAIIEGQPLLSRVVTVTGRGINHPQNFHALIGTSFSYLVEKAGGYTNKAERLIMGGPMMGYPMKTDELPVIKATNCILALPKEDLPYSVEQPMPCIRCGKCADVCPVSLLPQQLYWYARADQFDRALEYKLNDCIECGCCSYVCPADIPLVSYYRYAKSEIREEQEKKKKTTLARQRFEFREYRLARAKAERDAKRAQHKAALQKKKEAAKAARKGQQSGEEKLDPKQAAIQAALQRVQQKKAERKNKEDQPGAQQPDKSTKTDQPEQENS